MTLSLGLEAAWPAGVPAHPQPRCAVCLLRHLASAPNLTTVLSRQLPPSASPSRVCSSLGKCHFIRHFIISPSVAALLSPPIAPCPLAQGLQPLSHWACWTCGLGLPKAGQPPGWGALPGPGSCSHTSTSISCTGSSPGDGSGAPSAACHLLPWSCRPPLSLLPNLPLRLVSGLAPGWFGGPWLHPLAQPRLAMEVAAQPCG